MSTTPEPASVAAAMSLIQHMTALLRLLNYGAPDSGGVCGPGPIGWPSKPAVKQVIADAERFLEQQAAPAAPRYTLRHTYGVTSADRTLVWDEAREVPMRYGEVLALLNDREPAPVPDTAAKWGVECGWLMHDCGFGKRRGISLETLGRRIAEGMEALGAKPSPAPVPDATLREATATVARAIRGDMSDKCWVQRVADALAAAIEARK